MEDAMRFPKTLFAVIATLNFVTPVAAEVYDYGNFLIEGAHIIISKYPHTSADIQNTWCNPESLISKLGLEVVPYTLLEDNSVRVELKSREEYNKIKIVNCQLAAVEKATTNEQYDAGERVTYDRHRFLFARKHVNLELGRTPDGYRLTLPIFLTIEIRDFNEGIFTKEQQQELFKTLGPFSIEEHMVLKTLDDHDRPPRSVGDIRELKIIIYHRILPAPPPRKQ